ncbi:MAG: HEAT repeat domain-containing protein [bacterium]
MVFTLVLWVGSSSLVVVNRILYEQGQRRLVDIARQLTDPSLASLPPLERSPAIRAMLSRKSRRQVYRMIVSTSFPIWVTEICSAYALARWGLPRIVSDASPARGRRKWTRISALFALGHLRVAEAYDLLEAAVFDTDPDVASAASVVLHRLGDRRAAEILIAALQARSYSPSRLATQLDEFPVPIDDLLRPLLNSPVVDARYWAVSLLFRYPGGMELVNEVAALTNDAHPTVRKAAVLTLGAMDGKRAIPVALRLLNDHTPFVRTAAIRALSQRGALDENTESRRTLAAHITSSLADTAWEVRLAAKEALVAFGPGVWREVAEMLDSSDTFARNSAAEVLQNLGLIDRTIEEFGRGARPSAELLDVLGRAFREGGPAMVDAAIARSNPDLHPVVESLMTRLQFVASTSE